MLLLALACAPQDANTNMMSAAPLGDGTAAPEFTLVDVNPASPSFEQELGVSSVLERGSVWYFGHST